MERVILLYVAPARSRFCVKTIGLCEGLTLARRTLIIDAPLGLWMQDKPAQQQALSRSLADIPSILQPTVVISFLRAFWVTMAREWAQIEALRLDKYLYLIRQYVSASFRYLSRNNWGDTKAIEEHGRVMAQVPMNLGEGDGSRIPNGLRFHVLDVWVDELEKVDCEWGKEKKQVLEMLCAPVERLATEGRLKVVRTAAKECLADERLKRWRGHGKEKVSDDAKEDKEEEWVEEIDG